MINTPRLADLGRFPFLLLLVLLAVVAGAYWPGLSGDFLFDDYVNLNALGRYGGVRDWETLLFYLTSGIADPTGRPVAMASFLLDARDWPAEPWPFKRTNLVIHLLNGVLLYSVLVALGRRVAANTGQAQWAALLAAALWLLSPLWVSTVLYVVQRHAMLAALFVLVGVRLWVASREAFDQGKLRRGITLAFLAVPVAGMLAGLSKANGFLLPVLLAMLELTVLRLRAGGRAPTLGWQARYLRLVLVWIPAALILVWLLWQGYRLGLDGTAGRPWTLEQRLLSQPRALMEYLEQILIPGISARGVFADDFTVSRGWLEPWTTLPAMLLVLALAGSALVMRHRWPVMAAAILFFLAGHAMESSTIMLELYFEHRNYLPAALIFWPLAWWAVSGGRFRRWLLLGVAGYGALMLFATTTQAKLWGNPLGLAVVWAQQNPDSARAQTHAFHQERAAGREIAAEQRLVAASEKNPNEPQFALNLLDLRCEHGRASSTDVERAAAAIAASRGLGLDMNNRWLVSLLLPGSSAACAGLTKKDMRLLLQAATTDAGQPAEGDPEMQARAQRLHAHLALREGDCETALQAFGNRIAAQPRPEAVQTQVAQLAMICGPEYGLAHLSGYLDAGAPVSRASSPMLRLRDRLMRRWWTSHWEELLPILKADVKVKQEHAVPSAPPINTPDAEAQIKYPSGYLP